LWYLWESRQEHFDGEDDEILFVGDIFHQNLAKGIIAEGDVLFLGTTDGFGPFPTSKYSCWPQSAMPLNLHPKVRNDFFFLFLIPVVKVRVRSHWISLFGIMPGPCEFPDFKAFFLPLKLELTIWKKG
jgi:hypothetical protein